MATTFAPITSNTIWSIDIDSLYAQRRALFDIVNRQIDFYKSNSADSSSVVKDLIYYLSLTFREEHLGMVNANYPASLEHIKEHYNLIEMIEEFHKKYQEDAEDVGFYILAFLKDWILDHTTKRDVKFWEYLLNNADRLKQIQEGNNAFTSQDCEGMLI